MAGKRVRLFGPGVRWMTTGAQQEDRGLGHVRRSPGGHWASLENQRSFTDEVARKEGFLSSLDWLKADNAKALRKHGGATLLTQYPNAWTALRTIYPELPWPVIPARLPRNYWASLDHQRDFWKALGVKLGLNSLSEWNLISSETVSKHGGAGLLARYANMTEALSAAYEGSFQGSVHTRRHKPNGYWDSITNQRAFLQQLAPQLGVQEQRDWTKVRSAQIKNAGGSALLNRHGTFQKALEVLFPEAPWAQWRSESDLPKPKGHWVDVVHQREYLDQLASELDLQSLHQWREVRISQHPLLRYIVGSNYPSFFAALQKIYPEHDWNIVTKASRVPYSHWKSLEHQRSFMDTLGSELGLSHVSDWIHQPVQVIKDRGGAGLLSHYTNFVELLRAVYPEHPWDEGERRQFPRGYWDSIPHARQFMEEVKHAFQIETEEDWYRVSTDQIQHQGGGGLLRKYGSMRVLMETVYPEVSWKAAKFSQRDKRSEQRWMSLQLRRLFPAEELIEDYVHEQLTRVSGARVEIDVFMPAHQIGFEYNGAHHYSDLAAFGPLEMYQSRDEEKLALCQTHSIELSIIPFQWDGCLPTLHHLLLTTSGPRTLQLLSTKSDFTSQSCPNTTKK